MIEDGLAWADKYFAASVSEDRIEIVRTYIRNQQLHHQKQTFTDAYKRFLRSVGYEEDLG